MPDSPMKLSSVLAGCSNASSTVAVPCRGSLQNLCDCLAYRDAKIVKLDEKHIQGEELVTSLEVHLDELQEQFE